MKKRNLLYTLITILLPLSYVVFSSNSGGITGQSTSGCSCHGMNLSTTALSVTGIPSSGYVPGQTYTLTLSVTNPNFSMAAARAGFNVSCTVGSFATATGVKVSGSNNKEITHDGPRAMASGVASWTVDWTAPAAGMGTVTFHMSGNATNGNGTTSGDQPNYDPFPFIEAAVTSVNNYEQDKFKVYPNPVSDQLNIEVDENIINYNFSLFNLSGQMIKLPTIVKLNSNLQVDVSHLSKGTYLLLATINNKQITQKVIVE